MLGCCGSEVVNVGASLTGKRKLTTTVTGSHARSLATFSEWGERLVRVPEADVEAMVMRGSHQVSEVTPFRVWHGHYYYWKEPEQQHSRLVVKKRVVYSPEVGSEAVREHVEFVADVQQYCLAAFEREGGSATDVEVAMLRHSLLPHLAVRLEPTVAFTGLSHHPMCEWLLMPCVCSLQDLFQTWSESSGSPPLLSRWSIAYRPLAVALVEALNTLHFHCRFTHGDVSASNVLVTSTATMQQSNRDVGRESEAPMGFVLGDLGSLQPVPSPKRGSSGAACCRTTGGTTAWYSPPEALYLCDGAEVEAAGSRQQSLAMCSDVWSCGLVLMEALQAPATPAEWQRRRHPLLLFHPFDHSSARTSSGDERDASISSQPPEVTLWDVMEIVHQYTTECQSSTQGAVRAALERRVLPSLLHTKGTLSEGSEQESEREEIDACIDFLTHCLHPLPSQRWTMQQLQHHRWLRSPSSSSGGSSHNTQ